MESVNNTINAASRAIFGDSTTREEPVSGASGNTSKGEPYDAGNIESTERKEASATGPTTGSTAGTTTDTAAETSGKESAVPETNPTEVKDSSAVSGDHSKAQNDTRDPSDPATHPDSKETAAKKNVDTSADGPDKDDNPVKVDGPGPQPISEVAKHYGGDAGNAGKEGGETAEGEAEGGAPTGGDDEEEDGPQKVSHGEGTGEKYVKSSGLKADGGDFDAAAAGAGREADRLLEQKGIHHTQPGQAGPPADEAAEADESGSGGKVSLKDKIKAKLHKS